MAANSLRGGKNVFGQSTMAGQNWLEDRLEPDYQKQARMDKVRIIIDSRST
jgi:hypothetical protein